MPNRHELTQVAFLRGINVVGRRVTNEELASVFRAVGYAAAVPFQASGNVLLSGPPVEDPATVERALEDALGYPVPTMIRSAPQVAAIAEATPFTEAQLAPTERRVQVIFLAEPAGAADLSLHETDEDRLVSDGSEVYWLPARGMSTAAIDLDVLLRDLGTNTIRTQATIQRIARKLAAS